MFTQKGRLCVLVASLATFAMGATGCVGADRYRALKDEAAQAKQQLKEAQVAYAKEKLRVITLEKQNDALQAQTQQYHNDLNGLKESISKLQGLTDEWFQVRDDLIRLNMDRELARMRKANPEATGVILLEPVSESRAPEQTAQAVEEVITPETTEEELNRVLEQFRSLLKK